MPKNMKRLDKSRYNNLLYPTHRYGNFSDRSTDHTVSGIVKRYVSLLLDSYFYKPNLIKHVIACQLFLLINIHILYRNSI
jgi:hypothetical protein